VRVELTGLMAKPELNGQMGVILSLGEERHLVLLDGSSSPLALKPANLKVTGQKARNPKEEDDEPIDPWLVSQQQQQQQQREVEEQEQRGEGGSLGMHAPSTPPASASSGKDAVEGEATMTLKEQSVVELINALHVSARTQPQAERSVRELMIRLHGCEDTSLQQECREGLKEHTGKDGWLSGWLEVADACKARIASDDATPHELERVDATEKLIETIGRFEQSKLAAGTWPTTADPTPTADSAPVNWPEWYRKLAAGDAEGAAAIAIS
jgi:hypothetical protein